MEHKEWTTATLRREKQCQCQEWWGDIWCQRNVIKTFKKSSEFDAAMQNILAYKQYKTASDY